MAIGTVRYFNATKCFALITPDGGGRGVFAHASTLEAIGISSLSEGQRVSFDIQENEGGCEAVNLKLV